IAFLHRRIGKSSGADVHLIEGQTAVSGEVEIADIVLVTNFRRGRPDIRSYENRIVAPVRPGVVQKTQTRLSGDTRLPAGLHFANKAPIDRFGTDGQNEIEA